jgi:membrane peptidoglycan carboxypeptidase
MLKKVVSQGTARRIQWMYKLTNPIGGKTGTTNDNSDAWFIGITPELVTGFGLVQKIEALVSTGWSTDKGLQQRCQYSLTTCRKYIKIQI